MTTYDGLTTTRPYSTIDDLARHEILPGSEEHMDLATANKKHLRNHDWCMKHLRNHDWCMKHNA